MGLVARTPYSFVVVIGFLGSGPTQVLLPSLTVVWVGKIVFKLRTPTLRTTRSKEPPKSSTSPSEKHSRLSLDFRERLSQ